MKLKINLLYVLMFFVTAVSAQNLRKANHLFNNRAYVDAAELYLEEENKTADVYEKLADCYYFNSKMNEAATWYKTLIKNFPGEYHVINLYKYAQALKGINKFDEADKWMNTYNQKVASGSNQVVKTKPYFADLNASIDRPYIVNETIANGENSDFAPAYFGNSIVFSSTRVKGDLYNWNKQPYLDLFQAEMTKDGDLINVQEFSTDINTDLHEANAVFTKDGKTMYFTRNNNQNGKKVRDSKKISHLKIYRAELVDSTWKNVEELSINGENFSTEHPALSPDEKTLIFASDRPGGFGSFDLYKSTLLPSGKFSTPENLGKEINTKHREQFPFISSTNNLYFSSDGHFGMGGLDVFKSEAAYTKYKAPKNLSDKINSSLDDFGFIIDEAAETGYFSSNRAGKGYDAIYKFEQLKRFFIEGYVKDVTSSKALKGALVTLKDASGKLVGQTTVAANGFYSFEIEKNTAYTINASLEYYNPAKVDFKTNADGVLNKEVNLLLQSLQDAEEAIVKENGKIQIKIENIYFNFNKWDLKQESMVELDKVSALLKKYPFINIEIGAHTDIRGDDDFNMELSHLRAKAVMDYLLTKGINANRLRSVGYGESQQLNKCVRHGICTEEEYSVNRRCEFVILN